MKKRTKILLIIGLILLVGFIPVPEYTRARQWNAECNPDNIDPYKDHHDFSFLLYFIQIRKDCNGRIYGFIFRVGIIPLSPHTDFIPTIGILSVLEYGGRYSAFQILVNMNNMLFEAGFSNNKGVKFVFMNKGYCFQNQCWTDDCRYWWNNIEWICSNKKEKI